MVWDEKENALRDLTIDRINRIARHLGGLTHEEVREALGMYYHMRELAAGRPVDMDHVRRVLTPQQIAGYRTVMAMVGINAHDKPLNDSNGLKPWPTP